MITKKYIIIDGLNNDCTPNNGEGYTYNQGILISGLILSKFNISLAYDIANAV